MSHSLVCLFSSVGHLLSECLKALPLLSGPQSCLCIDNVVVFVNKSAVVCVCMCVCLCVCLGESLRVCLSVCLSLV